MNLRALAEQLPYPIQQPLRYIYGAIPIRFRFGKVFGETYNFLQQSQWWSKHKLEEYQIQQLTKLLHHAYKNVPYYRRVFDKRGLRPKDIQGFDDLKKLPFLTKQIIQDNLEDLIARNYPKSKLRYITTGGSSGIPMGFYKENGFADGRERAFITTQWNRVGYRLGDKSVVLRGDVVKSAEKGRYWQYNPVSKQLVLSSYHMTDETLPKYIEKIKKFKPDFIQAYPSAITILARFMKENKVEPFPGIKALLCGSENLYLWQRQLLEHVFQCRVYSWYGHTEQSVLAGECEKSVYYHVFPEYGFVELIGKDGKRVTRDGEIGEIVATGFNNYVTPFIRYRTADMGVYADPKCNCGRKYPLLKKVEGRLQEFIITKNNRLISMTAINMHSDVFDNVKQFQFYQDTKEKVVFNIVIKGTYTDRDTNYIQRELYKKLGDDVKLEIRFVEHIPRTKSGKYRFLIQKLPVDFSNSASNLQSAL